MLLQPEQDQKYNMTVDILSSGIGYGEIRNVIEVFDEIISNEEIFKADHQILIDITTSFLEYYKNHKENLLELVNYSKPEIFDEEEEWKTDDESDTSKPQTQTEIPSHEEEAKLEDNKYQPNQLELEELQKEINELQSLQHEIMNTINEHRYIKDLVIQSQLDLEAAEILQNHQCNSQTILLFQQAIEKGLKALWLKRGDLKYKVHNENFMTHKLHFLASMVLTREEREKEMDNAIIKQANEIKQIGRSSADFRPLCIRSRYASTDIRVRSQPWLIFSDKDTVQISDLTKRMLEYCADNFEESDYL